MKPPSRPLDLHVRGPLPLRDSLEKEPRDVGTGTAALALLVAGAFVVAVYLSAPRSGRSAALAADGAVLVGAQGFRFPLELIMHRAYTEGLMPVQMSFSGRNFDIVSGLSAIIVAAVLVRRPRAFPLVRVWNVAGAVLLANIVVIAMLSAPTPLRVFRNEPANVWITRAPWVWLPAVFVLAAVLGHLLVFRRLRREGRAGGGVPARLGEIRSNYLT